MDAGSGDVAAVTGLWLTSTEHWFWDVPRRVELTARSRAADGGHYVLLEVADGQPDGPMTLVAAPRSGGRWRHPRWTGRTDVLLWVLQDPAASTAERPLRPPSTAPDAWGVLTTSRERALALSASVRGDGGW